jgi:hypothetical protein
VKECAVSFIPLVRQDEITAGIAALGPLDFDDIRTQVGKPQRT